MAPGLRFRLSVAAALAACGIVALAYLPPRGGVRAPPELLRTQLPEATPARLRAQVLADAWRAVEAEVRLRESRSRFASDLGQGDSAEGGPLLLADGPDSVVSLVRPVLRAELDTAWRRLGLGATKISVVVIVYLPILRASGSATPAEDQVGGASYLLPDSTDRTTCGVLLPAGYWIRNLARTGRLERIEQFRESLKNSLGPCAFYAAYGNPGRPVRHWLANRNFDVALSPSWTNPGNPQQATWWLTDFRTGHWWWELIYRHRPSTVACLAGRAAGCRDAVLEGAGYGFDDSLPRVIAPARRWWLAQGLVPGERYLADVAREVGRDRFLRFWGSPMPVDTALAEALKAPVGQWTERWERRYVPKVPLGAAAPFTASLLAVLLGAATVATTAASARRRQVQ
jgi:hypothetical protein